VHGGASHFWRVSAHFFEAKLSEEKSPHRFLGSPGSPPKMIHPPRTAGFLNFSLPLSQASAKMHGQPQTGARFRTSVLNTHTRAQRPPSSYSIVMSQYAKVMQTPAENFRDLSLSFARFVRRSSLQQSENFGISSVRWSLACDVRIIVESGTSSSCSSW
jgi:hypothetical protein